MVAGGPRKAAGRAPQRATSVACNVNAFKQTSSGSELSMTHFPLESPANEPCNQNDAQSGASRARIPVPDSPRGELKIWATFQPGTDEGSLPVVPERPLGLLSDLVVTTLPLHYDEVLDGAMTAGELFDLIEDAAASVDDATVRYLLAHPGSTSARIARLDCAFAERNLSVAHGGPTPEYKARRTKAKFFKIGTMLARSQQQYPFLQWSDIGVHHPIWDPRTFLSPGPGQDQEVLLFRVQSSIDRAFRRLVVEWPRSEARMSASMCQDIIDDLDAVVRAMINLTRVRQVGEFDKLNRFLSPTGEVHGHATGSFSVWTFLAGYLLTSRPAYLDRLVDPENRWAYDTDARAWIDGIQAHEVTPLTEMKFATSDSVRDELIESMQRRYTDFHKVHRGAVRKHALEAMSEAAPAARLNTNGEMFDRSVETLIVDADEDQAGDGASVA